ncbi:MAG TPA: hypothetical protein VK745_16680 [Polyangiaceae bacterium]|jgi:hypothetical protein|nr:hypothetical protein [Polyangiaceae bacterium]
MPALLYSGEPHVELVAVLGYIDSIAEARGIKLEINITALSSVLRNIRFDFPHVDGVASASPFKKAACFVVYFVAESPISAPFPAGSFSPDILRLRGHQNALMAFELAVDALHGATVHRSTGDFVLEKRIQVSRHSYVDIIEALTTVSPVTSFKLVSVLLEQLAYRANPECSYPIGSAK